LALSRRNSPQAAPAFLSRRHSCWQARSNKSQSAVLRQGGVCVSIVSIVCAIKALVPLRAKDGLDPPMSILADAADGADDVIESALTCGRDPNCPHSQPPLAAEDNFNPKCAEERLCPAQPASECAGTLGPARPIDGDLQRIGCASVPLRSVSHDLAHKGRHEIGVDDILDRGAPVVRGWPAPRICPLVRAQGVIGLSQRKRRNRAKSPSVEQSVSPCSTASAAR
jgi:hypothetical protein